MSWPPVYARCVVWSCDLKPTDIPHLLNAGYPWVRPVQRRWAQTLCNPTIGRHLELLSHWDVGAVELDSVAGRRLLRGLAVRS